MSEKRARAAPCLVTCHPSCRLQHPVRDSSRPGTECGVFFCASRITHHLQVATPTPAQPRHARSTTAEHSSTQSSIWHPVVVVCRPPPCSPSWGVYCRGTVVRVHDRAQLHASQFGHSAAILATVAQHEHHHHPPRRIPSQAGRQWGLQHAHDGSSCLALQSASCSL